MSKKSKKKYQNYQTLDNKEKIEKQSKPEKIEEKSQFKKDFIDLAICIGFITAILLLIYYFDQKNDFIKVLTDQMFNAF